jgi:hypothetical protein
MVGSSDPSWRERYWISIQDVEHGDFVLTCGFGQYPNQDVQEAFVIVSVGGRQRNLRLSRSLLPDRDRLRTGPFSIEVVRPFEELHLVLDDNPSGISFDLCWLGRMEPIIENRHFQVSRARAAYDAMRYVQLGRATGLVQTPEGEWPVSPAAWWGERDHSWGTRPLPRQVGAPPAGRPDWRLLMFCPFQFEDLAAHFYLFEDEHGQVVHRSAGLSPAPGRDDFAAVIGVEHDLKWVQGAPAVTMVGGTVTFVLASGQRLDFRITPLPGRAHLRGGGYEGWNGWFQGHWKGEEALEHDVWDLTDVTQLYRYAKASSDHLFQVEHDGELGYGIIEYMVLPGHRRYGHAVPPRRSPE